MKNCEHTDLPCGIQQDARNTLMIKVDTLKTISYLDANVNDDDIRIAILHVQNEIIERVLGTCLADQLRNMICDNTINDPENIWYQELRRNYLYNIFAYGVPADLLLPISFKVRNQGVTQNNGDGFTGAPLPTIQFMEKDYLDKRDLYIKRTIDFIRCHREEFSLRCGCYGPCGCSIAPFNADYSHGLSLDSPPKHFRRW